ncbi:MAG TPA: PEP-CTERM sorting domain-containing protein [Stellaceae bacterium]|jgi:hypothetical protein|nr:PEP-CTERM sorting domain-containing protein [Stellaceae bacterium]
MRRKYLIAVVALAGAALASLGQAYAGPTTGKILFNKPPGNQGPTKTYDSAPPGGGKVTATGENGGDPDLYGTDEGFADEGVGIAGTAGNEIVPGTFVQLDLIDLTIPPLTSARLGFRASGITSGGEWEVFGTNTADAIDDSATLLLSGTGDGLIPDLGADIIGVYRYLDVTALSGGILLAELDDTFAAPEPTSLALVGAALFGFGMVRRRRR